MVSHTAVGFKGTVRQDGEARRMARLGPRFTVNSAADWAVTPTSADRTVSIAAGSGQACGVIDTTTAAESLQLPVNSSGQTRYDLIINRFKWTDPVTDPAFTYVLGTPGAGVPNIDALLRIPGTQYDGVLAVARVASGQGALTGNDIVKVAPVGSDGGLIVPQSAYMSVVDVPDGTQLIASDAPHRAYRKIAGTLREDIPQFASASERDTVIPSPQKGMRCMVGEVEQTYRNGGWRFRLSGPIGDVTDVNGLLSWAHGAGQAPIAWGLQARNQATDALNAVMQLLAWFADTGNLQLRATRTDTNSYLITNPVDAYWWADF